METSRPCPLCVSTETTPYAHSHGRDYFGCSACGLIFMDRAARLDPLTEKARYDLHENDPCDEGYRAYLARLADPLTEKLPPRAMGLDYGSGPGPTLSVMLEERGYDMSIFDPFFAPDPEPLSATYDFITCTETAEHFFDPHTEFRRLHSLLRPGGWLGVMTQFAEGKDFETWHYVREDTHVCFYTERTMRWLSAHYGFTLDIPRPGVALFRKQPPYGPATVPEEGEPTASR